MSARHKSCKPASLPSNVVTLSTARRSYDRRPAIVTMLPSDHESRETLRNLSRMGALVRKGRVQGLLYAFKDAKSRGGGMIGVSGNMIDDIESIRSVITSLQAYVDAHDAGGTS